MALRRVLDLSELDRGAPSAVIKAIDDAARDLALDLLETMRASPGCVGLAAPQIGVASRAFALDVTGHKKTTTCHGELVLFNATLLAAEVPETAREGCMSIPDLTGDVRRASRITLSGLDLEGNERIISTDGFEARAILHELDHLDGLVFLDRLAGPGALHTRRVYR